MSLQVEKLEHNMAKLTVEVAAEDVEKALQAAYLKQRKQINIPGFRKGKVPRQMIEKMYGPEVFYDEAANNMIPDAYAKAYDESELDIVSQPKIEVVQMEKGKPFIFTAEVATKPEVTLGDYKGLKVDKVSTRVTQKEVDEEIEKERERNDISLGGSVVSTSVKIAGDDFDEAIVRYMRKKHNLLIGERTAEDIKIKIGTCFPLAQNETMDVRGRNLVTGLPKTVTVSSEETEEALREPTLQIVEAVHSVLEKTPPELAADVADRGIVLTGGGALLRGLEELIEDRTGINTMTADDPMTCVAIGTGKYVEFLSGKRDDD